MTRESRPGFEPFPIATAALVALTLAMPLRWSTFGLSAIALTALMLGGLRRAHHLNPTVAATIALSIVDTIVLGYAAFALVRPGAFGPVTRLGYPLLVSTGLRLEGARGWRCSAGWSASFRSCFTTRVMNTESAKTAKTSLA